jgi:pimeloyl-ACP methyl ester carboxylesterase
MAAITEHEAQQVEQANANGRTPVVFIHGLWLLPSSWDNWANLFEEAGYAPVTPVWPDDPDTVEEARANPDIFAKKTLGQIGDHTAEVIGALDRKPAVMGHSTGGLLAQIIADRGLSAATVARWPTPTSTRGRRRRSTSTGPTAGTRSRSTAAGARSRRPRSRS